jgi:hypothetical protein
VSYGGTIVMLMALAAVTRGVFEKKGESRLAAD